MANINIFKSNADLDNNCRATRLRSGMSIKAKVYSTEVLGTAYHVRQEDDEVLFDLVIPEYCIDKTFTLALDEYVTTR